MAWAHVQSFTIFAAGPVTSLSKALTSPVAIGDTVFVQTCYADATGTFTDVVDDNLGNVYTLVIRKTNATSQQGAAIWKSIVTVAGTPTVRQRYNPTPGTSSGSFVGIAGDHFTGSDAASVIDGSNGQAQNAPGVGVNALSSLSFVTAKAGDLIFGAFQDCSTNGTITQGTGFTLGATLNAGVGNLLLQNEYLVQIAAGAITATATATNGADNYTSLGAAISPATVVPPGGLALQFTYWP